MLKKTVSFLVCICLMVGVGSTVLTASALTNISSASSSISISGTTAYVACSVYGYQAKTTRCSITANLQQYKNGGWVTIATWSQSYNNYRGALSASKTVSRGYSYRVYATFSAYANGFTEYVSLASKTTSC